MTCTAPMVWSRRLVLGLLLMLVWPSLRAEPVADIHVHAAYVINFIRYTRWPDARDPAASPYVLTVLGSGDAVRAMVDLSRRAGPIRGHEVRIVAFDPGTSAPPADATASLTDSLASSHAIFVTPQYEAWGRHVIDASAGHPVLTIGTGESFARQGGMLSLVAEDNRVVFVANADAIERAGIVVSAKVHQLARPLRGGSAP